MILEETEPNLFVEILLILTNSQRPLISTEIIYSFQKYFGQNDYLCKVSGLWGKTNLISGSKCFVQAGAGKSCFGLKKILIKLVPYMNLQIWRFPGGFFCFSLLFSFAFRSNYAFEYISNTKQIIQYIVSPDSGTQRVGMYKLFTAKLVLEKMREGKIVVDDQREKVRYSYTNYAKLEIKIKSLFWNLPPKTHKAWSSVPHTINAGMLYVLLLNIIVSQVNKFRQ